MLTRSFFLTAHIKTGIPQTRSEYFGAHAQLTFDAGQIQSIKATTLDLDTLAEACQKTVLFIDGQLDDRSIPLSFLDSANMPTLDRARHARHVKNAIRHFTLLGRSIESSAYDGNEIDADALGFILETDLQDYRQALRVESRTYEIV